MKKQILVFFFILQKRYLISVTCHYVVKPDRHNAKHFLILIYGSFTFWCGIVYLEGSLKQFFMPFSLKISSTYANDDFLKKVH